MHKHLTISLNDEDRKLLERIQKDLKATMGKLSATGAVRILLRKYFEV
jgi:hypothetical protein